MSVEFDRRCGTAQSEDCLQMYIPAPSTHASHPHPAADGGEEEETVSAWWPVLSKFHGVDGWPTSAVVLPGDNSVCVCLSVCLSVCLLELLILTCMWCLSK